MITSATEQIVREWIANKIATVFPFSARTIPAPTYFEDYADFWAVDLNTAYDEQDELDTSHIVFALMFFKGFTDDEDSPEDSPLVIFKYEIYCFSQYDLERADESPTPDMFDRKLLKYHNEFIAGLINLKAEFQGIINITGTGLQTAETLPLVQTEDVQNRVACEYIPGIRGSSAKFEARVRLQSEDC